MIVLQSITSQWEQEKSLTKSTSGSISSGRGVEYQSVGLTPPSSTSPETKANLLTNSVWSGSGLGSCGSVTSSVNNKSLTSDATIPVRSILNHFYTAMHILSFLGYCLLFVWFFFFQTLFTFLAVAMAFASLAWPKSQCSFNSYLLRV